MPSKVLNEQFIKTGLVCPENQHHIEYTSDDRSGLYVEVRSTSQGQGTFWFRFREKETGKTARVMVGRTTAVSIREAKEHVKNLRAKLQLGADLAGEQRKKKEILTWTAFFEQWYLPHAKQHLRSWANLEEMNRLRVAPVFGNMRLNKLTRHAVQQFHNELRESGLAPATCDHHLKFIRQALNLAVEWDLLDSNPVAKVKLFNVDNRQERVLTNQQLQKLMAVLASDKNRTVCLVIKFLYFTGARVNEALHARWADVDRKNRTLVIQAINSKSKQRRSIPLSDAAIAVLDQLGSEGKSEWLFNSRRGGRLSTISKVWARIRREAGLEGTLDGGLNWRLHDARHAAASAMISSGHSLFAVQKVLGHASPMVSQRYAHMSTAALQEAANSIGRYVETALETAEE